MAKSGHVLIPQVTENPAGDRLMYDKLYSYGASLLLHLG